MLRAGEMSRLFYIGGDQVHEEQKSAIFKTNIWKRIPSDFPKWLNIGPELHHTYNEISTIVHGTLVTIARGHVRVT